MHLYDVIKRPVTSEKTERLGSENQYVFEVDVKATKQQVRDAVQAIFGVNVIKVNTMLVPAKRGQRLRKTIRRKRAWKKAIVTVAPGQKIDLFGV
jgi:large subunit ribosomal protein L23